MRRNQTDASGAVIERFTVGPMGVNCYLVADPSARTALLIDPGASPRTMQDYARRAGFEIKAVVNTHGHGDHIAANAAFAVPIAVHRLDAAFLTDPGLNLSRHFFFEVKSPAADRLLEEGDAVTVGSLALRVIHTPGHTPGSISLALGGVIFTGDALFAGGIGRTDFPYGDEETLIRAIREKLLVFSDETVIYPGHGPESTIGRERGAF